MTGGAGDLRLWGYDDRVAASVEAGARVGRVVQVDRGECDVVTAEGMVRAGSDSVRAQAEIAPVTGDWVQVTSRRELRPPRRRPPGRRSPEGADRGHRLSWAPHRRGGPLSIRSLWPIALGDDRRTL